MRKQIAAANWKMNLTINEGELLIDEILKSGDELPDHRQVILAVPFPYLSMAIDKIKGRKNFFIAAQNCHFRSSGAFTGEVSAAMLHSVGVSHVIIGHSERREYFSESHTMLAAKVDLCFNHDLKPVFCCGEPLSIRETEAQNNYVEMQLTDSLFHLSAEQLMGFIIAYEPIWAIGTGRTASSAQAEEMHRHIRNVLSDRYGNKIADSISILYGGSVKASNAKEIFGEKDVDGGLIGGASLQATEFATIIHSLK